MKKNLLVTTIFSVLASSGFAAVEMSSALPQDNQCRIQAKEIALQTYQTCVSDTRTAKIEQIRKEYQEKITELKKQYETQISELKSANATAAPVMKPVPVKPEPSVQETPAPVAPAEAVVEPETTLPTTLLDESPEVVEPAKKPDVIESQELTLTEPTVTLRPANPKVAKTKKPSKKTTPVVTTAATKVKPSKKVTQKSVPTVAQKRAQGEKGVKGIAKTFPEKQKPVETKPASPIVTQNELSKTAAIQRSELEKTEITQAPLPEETLPIEKTVIDEGLSGAQAEIQSSQQ